MKKESIVIRIGNRSRHGQPVNRHPVIRYGGDSTNSDLSYPSLLVASRSLRVAQLIPF